MNSFERGLQKRIALEVPDLAAYTPGLVIDVHLRGRRKGRLHLGRTYDFYDLASLTKIIFTASVGIDFFGASPGRLRQPVNGILPWWPHARTTPFDLLTHTAGLQWWRPFYKKLSGPMEPQIRWDQLKKQLARTRPERRPKAVYSDLDLFLIGAYLEAAKEQSLQEMWNEVASRLSLEDIFFHPRNRPKFARRRYAPTEIHQGEVHDENAWALGGIAPHAGLFGTAEAVSEWGLELRRAFLGGRSALGDARSVRRFVRRRIPVARGDWGLGFMKPTRGGASCGKYFSRDSFGHTGFTGTSYWYDPAKDLQVVILSNRVYPTRENKKFVGLRPRLHDWICQQLG
jgi:CubicO group peptidase (beta-lactamase class C family)